MEKIRHGNRRRILGSKSSPRETQGHCRKDTRPDPHSQQGMCAGLRKTPKFQVIKDIEFKTVRYPENSKIKKSVFRRKFMV